MIARVQWRYYVIYLRPVGGSPFLYLVDCEEKGGSPRRRRAEGTSLNVKRFAIYI